jgi:hypothetical protein
MTEEEYCLVVKVCLESRNWHDLLTSMACCKMTFLRADSLRTMTFADLCFNDTHGQEMPVWTKAMDEGAVEAPRYPIDAESTIIHDRTDANWRRRRRRYNEVRDCRHRNFLNFQNTSRSLLPRVRQSYLWMDSSNVTHTTVLYRYSNRNYGILHMCDVVLTYFESILPNNMVPCDVSDDAFRIIITKNGQMTRGYDFVQDIHMHTLARGAIVRFFGTRANPIPNPND